MFPRRAHPAVELTVTVAAPVGGHSTAPGDRMSLSLQAFLDGTYTRVLRNTRVSQ